MKEEFDLLKLVEGLDATDARDFITSTLTPQAKEAYLAKRKDTKLQGEYEAEIAKVEKLPFGMRIKKMAEIKNYFRSRGLRVY